MMPSNFRQSGEGPSDDTLGNLPWRCREHGAWSPGWSCRVFWSQAVQPPDAQARDQFASDRAGAPAIPFDGKRAMGYLKEICQIGTRISGPEGMKKQQDMLKTHFEELGAKVEVQSFQARQNSRPISRSPWPT